MTAHRDTLNISTSRPIELIDITDQVKEFVSRKNLPDGLLLVSSPHTTLGIALNERCDHLQKDMIDFLTRIAPPEGKYRHNEIAVDGRPNAHSHLLSLFIPNQVTVAIREGKLDLGTWQSLFAVELDGPRPSRKIHLNAITL